MRGRPFVQLLFVVLVFTALGLPVWRLTRPITVVAGTTSPDPRAAATTATATPAETALEITATFAPAPAEFRFQHLGRDVLSGHGPATEFTGTYRTMVPAEGIDLTFQARWPAGAEAAEGPAAARVRVRYADGGRPDVEKTFWASRDAGNDGLVEIITVPGEGIGN